MALETGRSIVKSYKGYTDHSGPGRSKGRNTMLNKKLVGAALLAAAAVSGSAMANDRGINTVAGAVVGAAIGNSAGGRDGAIVGGLVGAAVGNSINTGDRYYRGGGGYVQTRVYSQPAPVYYEPAPVYYEPAPRYYAPQVVYVEPGRGYYHDRGYREYREYRGDRGYYDHDRGERHHGR